jgi:hypothetical protein
MFRKWILMANTSNPYKKRSVDYDVSEEMMGLPRRYYCTRM